MARNEEKQQGRLNRLWLQKEREEGRLKDSLDRRPKLSSLSSAPAVRKWIPSIKNEIEYYLQQSQLSHYPERKIAEFQLHIQALEKEYKSFVTKLRVLDPTCKHKPWTPRAYSRRRAETEAPSDAVKRPRHSEAHCGSSQLNPGECDSAPTRQVPAPTRPLQDTSVGVCADQDQPLSFDHTRLAVAAAAFRGLSGQRGFSQTQNLARVLRFSLPNLSSPPSGQTSQGRDGEGPRDGTAVGRSDYLSDCHTTERTPGKASGGGAAGEKAGHVLGLGCYSSSDEESDTLK
ncbi:uncharacterized protein ACBR49_007677 [Aulostomus maculatus]